MFTDEELRRYFKLHNVTSTAQEYIRLIRSTPPSRRVGLGATDSRAGSFFSHKMGCTVQTESEGPEGSYFLIAEWSDDFFEIWDQLHSIEIQLHPMNGRQQVRPYTADFLVLTKTGPRIVGCKSAKEAHQLVKNKANDWSFDNGQFHHLAAEKGFAKFDLEHEVYVPNKAHALLASNLSLLLRARRSPNKTTPALLKAIKTALSERPVQTLEELKRRCDLEDNTPLLRLIDQKLLHARTTSDNLSEEKSALVSALPEYFDVLLATTDTSTASLPTTTFRNLPPARHLQRGISNLKNLDNKSVPARTRRYWKEKLRKQELLGRSPLVVLTPRYPGRGGERFGSLILQAFERFVKEKLPSLDKGVCEIHKDYELFAKEVHPRHVPMKRTAFSYRLKTKHLETAQATGGRRAENAAKPASDIEDRIVLPQRPWELAHIDHYNADLHICVSEIGTKKFVVKVWITVMVDQFSGVILAVWISTRAPSRRACAMVIRRCVRRHDRLPENILTDHGAEFESVYYTELLAHCKINKKERPSAHGRFGAAAETAFKLFIQKYLKKRPGYIRAIFNRRGRSSSHSSERTARLTPELFFEEFMAFIDWRNDIYVAPNQHTPASVIAAEKLRSYSCSGIPIAYDDELIIASAIETKDCAINPHRGIQTSVGWHVNSDLLILAGSKPKRPDIREDPEQPYRLYVELNGTWITARHASDPIFQTKGPNQRAAETLRVIDANSTRQEVKDHADNILREKITEFDKKLDAAKSPNKEQSAKPTKPPTAPLPRESRKPIAPLREFKLEVDHELV